MSARTVLRRVAKVAVRGLGVLGVVGLSAAAAVEVRGIPKYEPEAVPEIHVAITPERVARGQKLAGVLCLDCHTGEGGRLTGKRLGDVPPIFGEVVSRNITKHPEKGIGGWSDTQLVTFLRTGVRPDGQYVPPWMLKLPNMADEDMASLVAFLRSDDPRVAASDVDPPGRSRPSFVAKALTNTVMKPLPYPKAPIVVPPREDRVAYGRYLSITYDCFGCHSADFAKQDILVPERSAGYFGGGNPMKGASGEDIATANLTADDETGIGRWSREDFSRAVKQGFRPDGRVLRPPMGPKPELEDDEVDAIYTYLRTVPKIRNAVDRRFAPAPTVADPGARAFSSYGCAACHGESGDGRGTGADLRRANEHFPSDAELRAWIDEAPAKKPGTRMPGWKGRIAEADYGPLLGHVRTLARGPREASNAPLP